MLLNNTISRLLYFGAFLILIASCVPRKKLVYLQHGDELKNIKDIEVDTVLRTYKLDVEEYKIQPLDLLSITFESITSDEYDFFSKLGPEIQQANNNNNLLLAGILVDTDGNIEYPVVGKISVNGLTVFEAQDKLQNIANQYLKDAVVRIRLLNFRFTVLGEVNGERVVNSLNTRVNLMEAIGMSGGFGELADRSKIKIIRQKGNEAEILYVNALDENYMESENFFLQQNDIIIVPPLKQRMFRRYFAANLGIWTSTISAILLIITLLNN